MNSSRHILLHHRWQQAAGPDDDSDVRFDARREAVRTVDLLAIDDFGRQSDTTWAREKLYQMVNYRVNHDQTTVVTSN